MISFQDLIFIRLSLYKVSAAHFQVIVSVHTAPQRTVTVLACNASFIAMGIILNSLSMKGLNNPQHIFYSGPNCPPLFQCIWSGALLI